MVVEFLEKSHLVVPLGSASLSKEEGTPHLVIAVPVMTVEETVRMVARSHYGSWWYASSFSTSRGSAAKGMPRRFAAFPSIRSSEVWLHTYRCGCVRSVTNIEPDVSSVRADMHDCVCA